MNKTFTLLVISDTHLLDDQTVPGNASNVNRASQEAVASYLRMEQPDYVVHLGDLISGEAANDTEDVVVAVRQILSPMGENDDLLGYCRRISQNKLIADERYAYRRRWYSLFNYKGQSRQ